MITFSRDMFCQLGRHENSLDLYPGIRVISETNHMILSSFYFRSSQVPLPASLKADLRQVPGQFPPRTAGASDVWQSNLSGGPGGFAPCKGSLGRRNPNATDFASGNSQGASLLKGF